MALNSKTNLKLIDAICEGPIGGLVHHRKGVFLDETAVTFEQLQNKTVYIKQKIGAKNQDILYEKSGFSAFADFAAAASTVQNVGRQIGSSYSEDVDESGLRKGRPKYGAGQVIIEVTDTEVDFVKLLFTVNRLYCVAVEGLARGQLFSAKIKLQIEIQDQTAGYDRIPMMVGGEQKNVIEGIAASSYQIQTDEIDIRAYKLPLQIRVRKVEFKNDPENAFEIKIEDLSKELPKRFSLDGKRADEIIWTNMTLGKRVKTVYPHTALAFLSLDAEEYGTLPARAYEVRGLKVKIPTGCKVKPEDGSLEFDEKFVFDGRLQDGKHWTTCPVCCFYNLLTNKRYGCGDFIDESNLNWVDLVQLSRYCNEEVEIDELDGQGNKKKEPRFAINTVLGSQAEAYNVLQDMASVFRGMLFWKADNVQVAGDHGELEKGDVEAVHVYSNSNVVNGSFVYSGSSLKTRSTRVRVRYNDPENFYKSNFMIIEDRKLIDKYGIQEKSVVAFGCTSKHQAQRMGRWIMQSEKLHDETITFAVGLEGLNVLPGQVFEVSDEMRLGVRLAGRIVGAGEGFVDIDQTASMPSGSNNKLTVVMADGTVETQPIQSNSGTRINVSTNFTQIPPDNALYAIRNDSAKLAKYRCLSVTEGEAGVYSITGVKHVDGIYRAVEDPNSPVELAPPFFYSNAPEKPSGVRISFEAIDDSANSKLRATVSWTRGTTAPVSEFQLKYKVGDANWIDVNTANNYVDIESNLTVGAILYVKVRSIGLEPIRNKSDFEPAQKQIPAQNTGDLTGQIVVLPPDPEDVTLEVMGGDQVVLRWSAKADGQKLNNFVAHIRHNSDVTGAGNWYNSSLIRKIEARATSAVLPLMNGEYLVKFVNEQKQRSQNAASAVVNIPDALPRHNFELVREDPPLSQFSGQKTKVAYSDVYDGLIFDGDASFDAIASVDAFTANIDTHLGTRFTEGEYVFHKVMDLGAVFSVRLSRLLKVRSLYLNDLIDDRTENVDTWTDFDGIIPDDTNVELYFRKSDLGVSDADTKDENGEFFLLEDGSKVRQESDLAFEEWIPLENNVYVGRSFQFKAVLSSDSVDETPLIDELGVLVQFERRTENSDKTLNSGTAASGKPVTFQKAFYTDSDTTVTVGITAFDLAPGDHFVISEPTATGFSIVFKNSVGGVINRKFQYTAIGYGTQQA